MFGGSVAKAGSGTTLAESDPGGQAAPWWTSEQIYRWEVLPRGVQAIFDAGNSFTFRAAQPVREAALLVLKSRPEPTAIGINGQAGRGTSRIWLDFEFDAVPVDVVGEVQVQNG